VDGLARANRLALSPDGRHLYVTGESDNAITVFERSAAVGRLTFRQSLRDGSGGVDGIAGAYDVAVSPDGRHVYATGGDDDAVALFARDGLTGQLSYMGKKGGGDGTPGLDSAGPITISADGQHVYVGSRLDDAVVVFARDTLGQLTYSEMHKDGVGATTALDQVESIAVSPDGAHVYVAALRDHSITVFSRSAVTGRLVYVETQGPGPPSHGLGGATSVRVSPDGSHVYAVGYLDWTVSVFGRAPGTGALTFVQRLVGGAGGLEPLAGPTGLAVGPGGARVYVASATGDSLLVFMRDPVSGALTFAEAWSDGVGDVDGVGGVLSVVVAPDDANIYSAAYFDNSVAAFAVLIFGDGFEQAVVTEGQGAEPWTLRWRSGRGGP
jgi:6-phosphogluconolactonase (cycloisomerase 2 family)